MLSYRTRIVLDTLLPQNGDDQLDVGLFDTDFESFYETFEAGAPAMMRVGFRAALFTAVWIAPTLIGLPPPLTLYYRETRDHALEALLHSRSNVLRQMAFLLRATCCFHFGGDSVVREKVGYPEQFDAHLEAKE